ncbi:Serine/threonine-protein kinase SRPK [Tolypocladium capitatum]|uniref:non-specific serine/threonine protein kinase n=1 Tax=Tolypocladium capitatum TaxID=45235 RepID=A0A2K3QQH3_9HYPO|nr:Serine/threonine-protein kinase SRPK [Tolypocladium capitatum]
MLLGIHLIHGHCKIAEVTVLLGSYFEEPRGCWAKATPIEQIGRLTVHGHIFAVGNDGPCAYEYQESPLPDLSGVGRGFLEDFVDYLEHCITGLIGLQLDNVDALESALLGADWDCKVDIWNLGLIIWELAEGRLLFDGLWTPNDNYTPEAHLAQMTAVFGSIPRQLLDRSRNRDRYFDADGHLLKPSTFPPCSMEQFSKNTDRSGLEREEFLRFIESMVAPDPEDRPDASKLLESPWLAQ